MRHNNKGFGYSNSFTHHQITVLRLTSSLHWAHGDNHTMRLKGSTFCFFLRLVFLFWMRSKSGVNLTLKIAFNVCVWLFLVDLGSVDSTGEEGPQSVCQGLVFVRRRCRGVARGCRRSAKWYENSQLHTAVQAVPKILTLWRVTRRIMRAPLTMKGCVHMFV